jgi:hypothetical protein
MKMFLMIILSYINTAFSQTTNFDFDGKLSDRPFIFDKINSPEVNSQKDNFIEKKLFRVLENGATEEVLPLKDEKGKTYYKFRPNDKFYSRYKCNSSDASLTYKVCEKYVFYPKYGGHNHDANIPPYTDWNNQQLTNPACSPVTQVNNYSYIYFKAPEFATRVEHTIQFYGACSGTYYDTIDIKIDGLVLLQSAWQDSLHGGVTYYQLVGETPSHPVNHFARPQTIDLLKQIAWEYYLSFSTYPYFSKLEINDISLIWGGLFDINANWHKEHNEHRYGNQVDLRRIAWISPTTYIMMPKIQEDKLIEIACNLGVQAKIESKDGTIYDLDESEEKWRSTAPHFHLRFPISNEVYVPEDVPPDLSICYRYFK